MILGANGVQTLSIPVKKSRGKHLFKDIRIDYEIPWQKNHWKSLEAAYASSPYFEFIIDDLSVFYLKRTVYLMELNLGLIEMSLHMLGLQSPVSTTSSFTEINNDSDPRNFIHPKLNHGIHDSIFHPIPYHQVFSERHGFQANLSILDLLFNEGPGSLAVLQKCLRI